MFILKHEEFVFIQRYHYRNEKASHRVRKGAAEMILIPEFINIGIYWNYIFYVLIPISLNYTNFQ